MNPGALIVELVSPFVPLRLFLWRWEPGKCSSTIINVLSVGCVLRLVLLGR